MSGLATGWQRGVLVLGVLLAAVVPVSAYDYGTGVDFPAGSACFIDDVINYDPTWTNPSGPVPGTGFDDPRYALGTPDMYAVALGNGGLLELAFTDNALSSDGAAGADLAIFANDPLYLVAVKPNAATQALLAGAGHALNDWGYVDVDDFTPDALGRILINLDQYFTGFAGGQLIFTGVMLVDDPNTGDKTGNAAGSDVSAVGAINSASASPEPASLTLLGLASAALIRRRARR